MAFFIYFKNEFSQSTLTTIHYHGKLEMILQKAAVVYFSVFTILRVLVLDNRVGSVVQKEARRNDRRQLTDNIHVQQQPIPQQSPQSLYVPSVFLSVCVTSCGHHNNDVSGYPAGSPASCTVCENEGTAATNCTEHVCSVQPPPTTSTCAE